MKNILPSFEIPLWPDGAPSDNGLTGPEESSEPGFAGNVSRPSLTVYPAAEPCGEAVVLCPGGGLQRVAIGHEGHDFAGWFGAQGVTCAVLKYRLPNGRMNVPLDDARQALRIMRRRAPEWGASRTGVMGASIGGYIAASTAVFPEEGACPDFQILLYPVISLRDGLTHRPSRDRLMGADPSAAAQAEGSLDGHVKSGTAPAFIALAEDDATVSPENSLAYYRALMVSGVPGSLHIYPSGGHGFGFRDSFAYKEQWTAELRRWLSGLSRD